MRKRGADASMLLILASAAFCIATSFTFRFQDEAWKNVINGDGEGYYAYLTGVFIKGDISKAECASRYFVPAGTARVLHYTSGVALLESPFFLVGHAYTLLSGRDDPQALGLPYQLSIALAALAYFILGLWSLRRLMIGIGIKGPPLFMALCITVFGSGITYYTVMTPSIAHVYGFSMVAFTLDRSFRAWQGKSNALLLAAVGVALCVLIRPTLILLLAVLPMVMIHPVKPFMDWVERQGALRWMLAAVVAFGILSIQPLLSYAQCGLWFADTYAGEGFDQGVSKVWPVLFGARKGLFFYWPLLLLAIPGLVLLIKQRPLIGILTAIGMLALILVTSAWWNWYYGHSYGMRPFIDILPVLCILTALFLNATGPVMRKFIFTIAVPLMVLQVFQSWQYVAGIIHPFNMDLEKYRMIFLKHGNEYRDMFGWSRTSPPFAPNGLELVADTSWAVDHPPIMLGRNSPYSPTLVLKGNELPTADLLYAQVSFYRTAMERGASDNCSIVLTIEEAGSDRVRASYPMNDIRLPDDRSRRHWHHAFIVPPAMPGEELRLYLWLPDEGRVKIEDLRMSIHRPRDP